MVVGLGHLRVALRSATGCVLLALIVAYLYPLVHAAATLEIQGIGDIGEALARSVGFGLALSGLTTALGALLAVATRRALHPEPRLLAALLLPAFLGDTIFAYVSRCLFPVGALLSERGSVASLSWLLALQVLQHLPLAVCLYLIVFDRISQPKLDFARAAHMSASEEVRFLLVPEAAALTVVLGIYFLYAGVNNYDLPTILLRASKGTDLEFLNHALNRHYAISPLPSKVAIVMSEGAVAAGILLVLGGIWLAVWQRLHGWIVGNVVRGIERIAPSGATVVTRWGVVPALLGVATLLPVVGVLVGSAVRGPGTQVLAFSELEVPVILRSLLATVGAAALIVTALLLVSVWIRLRPGLAVHFRHTIVDAGPVLAICVGLSVPSMCIALAAIYWRLTLFRSVGSAFLLVPWAMAHFVAELPVLLFFLYVASLGVKDNSVDFARVTRMSTRETIGIVFCDRNRPAYVLTYLLGITLIWSNTAVNTLFGPYVYPAAVALHNALTSGRGLVGAATLLVVPTTALAGLCCMTFYAMINREVR